MSVITGNSRLHPNVVKDYKGVTVNVGCKVSRQMTNLQPTDEGIFSNLEKSIEETQRLSHTEKLFLEAILRSSEETKTEVLKNLEETMDEVAE